MLRTTFLLTAAILFSGVNCFGQCAQYRSEITSVSGDALSSLSANDSFLFSVHVQDIRNSSFVGLSHRGVFAAYVDVSYDDSLFQTTGDFLNRTTFPLVPRGILAAGSMTEAGGLNDNLAPTGSEEMLVFSVPMTALVDIPNFAGDFAFSLAPPQDQAQYGTALYGLDTVVMAVDDVLFLGTEDVPPDTSNFTCPATVPEPASGLPMFFAVASLAGFLKRPRRSENSGSRFAFEDLN